MARPVGHHNQKPPAFYGRKNGITRYNFESGLSDAEVSHRARFSGTQIGFTGPELTEYENAYVAAYKRARKQNS